MTQNATDFENQVINLVKAAMSGDEEANDVIVQIIEAAKKGDEQALKVVALIKQLTQSNSDQAEEGTEENAEVMKCGGKVRAKMKAKKSAEKKEEGGEIPEEKCGGTAKKMRKAACKAKKCEEGDKLTDTQKFLLGAKCGCKVKKTKKCEEGDTLDNWEDPLSVKCGGKAKKVKKGENGIQLPKGAHGRVWSKSTSAVFAKGENTCPCALKRVGGKIVTVDSCTGLPIHKQGGSIKKYQNPAEPIVHKRLLGLDLKYDPNTNEFYIGESGPDVWEEASWDKIANMRGSQELIDKLYNPKKRFNPKGGIYIDKDKTTDKVVWSRSGRFPSIHSTNWINADNQRMQYNNGVYIINPGEDNEETLNFSEFYDRYPKETYWLSKYNNVGYRGEEIPYKDGKAQWDPEKQTYVYKIYRTVSGPATEAGESTEGSASAASQSATAATAGSSTTAQQGTAASATSTSSGASSQSGSKQNFAEWLKQNAPQYQSYQERKKLAQKYGIQNYKGSLQQNLQMWDRMKNDSTLKSQASPEATVIREVTRVAPLPNSVIPASKKVEFPTIRLANRKTLQSVSLPNEGTEYETPQRTYYQRLPQVEY